MLDCMLVAQHVNVNDFCKKVNQMVIQGYHKADFWMCKFFWVIVNIMHHLHTLLEMGVQEAMKSCWTDEFGHEHSIVTIGTDCVLYVIVAPQNWVNDGDAHYNLDEGYCCIVPKILKLNRQCDFTFFDAIFEKHQNRQLSKVFMQMEMTFVRQLFLDSIKWETLLFLSFKLFQGLVFYLASHC